MQQVTLLEGRVERTEDHDYYVWIDDVRLGPFPSVTRLLKTGRPWYTAEHASRGQQVHELTEAFDLQGCVAAPDELQGYIEAYDGFRRDMGSRLSFDLIEEPFVARCGGVTYGGTLDRLGILDDERTVIDIKSGSKTPEHALQLAAYGIPHGATRGVALYLKKTGVYRLDLIPNLEPYFDEFIARCQDAQ